MRTSPDAAEQAHGLPPAPEFSRPFAADKLGQQAAVVELEAKPAERKALVERFDLQALETLNAELKLVRAGGGVIRVTGRLRAEGAQICVVTLDPVPFALDQEVALAFAPAGTLADSGEVVVEAEGEDAPEPIEDGAIDLGEAMAQSLAVALDPYPRAAGARLEQSEFGPGGAEPAEDRETGKQESPFAALKELKRGPGQDG
jgi:uncharacterized metal-binding protein YceD (DUF177 family)